MLREREGGREIEREMVAVRGSDEGGIGMLKEPETGKDKARQGKCGSFFDSVKRQMMR